MVYFSDKKASPHDKDFPGFLGLTLSLRCQAKCIYCPPDRGELIEPKDMPLELTAKIIDEAAQSKRVETIHLAELGEALLSPHFIDTLKYLRQKMPEVCVWLHTNMLKMDQIMAAEVLKLGLNEITPNIDGASRVTFEYSKGISFEKVKQNLLDFIELRNKMNSDCKITIQALPPARYLKRIVGIDTDLPDDSEAVENFWQPLLSPQDSIVVMRGGYRWAIRNKVKKTKTGPCLFLNRDGINPSAHIAPNGNVYVCCMDHNAKISFGNVWENSLSDIWNRDTRKDIMFKLNNRQYGLIGEPCIFCDQSPLSDV